MEVVEAGGANAQANAATLARLASILQRGLRRPARVPLTALFRNDQPSPLDLGSDLHPAAEPRWADYAPPEPGALSGVLGGQARYQRRVAEARDEYDFACWQHQSDEVLRRHRVQEETARHQAMVAQHQAAVHEHNRRIEAIGAGLAVRDQESVQTYLEWALERTPLPRDVPRHVEVAYSPRYEHAVVRFELPAVDVIPPVAEIDRLHRSLMSQIVLLYLRDLFESDPNLRGVELSGHIREIDPVTGQWEYPCVITVAADRARYATLNLHEVAPEACLTQLGAQMSRHLHRDVEPTSRRDVTRMTATQLDHLARDAPVAPTTTRTGAFRLSAGR